MALDPKVIADAIDRVFSGDVAAFETSLKRLRLQSDLVQINSKIANVQAEADKDASSFVQTLDELAAMHRAKQEEIDALEK